MARELPPPLKSGEVPAPYHLNVAYESLRALRKLRGEGGLLVEGATGHDAPRISRVRSERIQARLTGVYASGYPWEQVIIKPGRVIQTTGVVGSPATGSPAYERRKGDATLTADGTIYEFVKSPASNQWVFPKRAATSTTCLFTIGVTACPCAGGPVFTCFNAGQSITVKQGLTTIGTFITDSAGRFTFTGSSGVYNFTGTRTRFNALNTNLTLNCVSPTGALPFTPASGFHCCNACNYPVADTLNIALNGYPTYVSGVWNSATIYDTGTITYNPAVGHQRWEGTTSGGRTITFTNAISGGVTINGTDHITGPPTGSPNSCPLGSVVFSYTSIGFGGAQVTE